jgi:hypothetical protein
LFDAFLHRALVVLLLSLAIAPRAAAQSEAAAQADSPEYREYVNKGTQEFELGNFAEARALFEKAHGLQPNARTLRALGVAEFELRNYQASAAHLRDALASDVKPLAGEMRNSAEALLRRAQGFVGQVRVEAQPSSATILLDGQPLDGHAEALWVAVGDRVFEFHATGYATQRRTLRIVGGEKQTLRVELTPLETSTSGGLANPMTERRANEQPLYKKWWLWTTVGVAVVASGAVASYFLLKPEPETRYGFRPSATTPPGYGIILPPASAP